MDVRRPAEYGSIAQRAKVAGRRAVVGQTTIRLGQATTLTFEFMMHERMGGYHEFWVPVRTNDRTNPEQRRVVRSTWGP